MASPARQSMTPNGVLTVSELLRSVRDALERRFPLLWVRGELSNLSRAPSGHCYFTLKDAAAQVDCVMFRSRAAALDWEPRDGARVDVCALVTLYEPRGRFQLTEEGMRPAGLGPLYERFLRLKEKLEREGLFDLAAKREPPAFPGCIGVLTSPAAAALRDVLTTLARRNPAIPVIVYPVPVQGEGAAARIAAMLASANARDEYAMQNTDSLARRLVHPGERLRSHQQLVTQLRARLAFGVSQRIHRCSALLERFQATLASVDPTAVLARGYSITRSAAGELLRDSAQVRAGERLHTTLARGSLESEVRKKSNL